MKMTNLTDILEEYAIAAPFSGDQAILSRMTKKYPEFAAELEDFAAARAVLRFVPEPELTAEQEINFKQIGLQNLQTVLSENARADAHQSLQSLTETAKAKGLSRSKFAAALGLSVSLVQYLEKRRLEFASIPSWLIAKIGQVLELKEDSIAVFLNQSVNYAAQRSYKTETRAEELPPKNFADAVREDQTLSAGQKHKLLEM